MENRIADIQMQLDSISEDLTDVSIGILREALDSGATTRPAVDKKLSQARRAVEKASRILGQSIAECLDEVED